MSSSNSVSESVWAAKKEATKKEPVFQGKENFLNHSIPEGTPTRRNKGSKKASASEIHKAIQDGTQLLTSTALNLQQSRALFLIQAHVEKVLTQFLWAENFTQIHTPKLIPSFSDLPELPPLYMQMSICADFCRVFEITPPLFGEDSQQYNSTSLQVEMEIKKHYSEIIDIVDRFFVGMFDSLNQNCKKDLQDLENYKPLKYLQKTLRLTFKEGIQMLKEVGVEITPLLGMVILDWEAARKLGQLVLEKYDTEFYILHRYPADVMPFYAMPSHDDPDYSNSFAVFIRGVKIISGAQHIHEPDLLRRRAIADGSAVDAISSCIDSFRYGAPLHGGFGADLERIAMLFCGLNYIH